jgi:hypothetical protein
MNACQKNWASILYNTTKNDPYSQWGTKFIQIFYLAFDFCPPCVHFNKREKFSWGVHRMDLGGIHRIPLNRIQEPVGANILAHINLFREPCGRIHRFYFKLKNKFC